MKNMYIIKNNSSIILNNGDNDEVIFSFNEYKDILKNLSTEKYDFFKIIHEKYSIKNKEEIFAFVKNQSLDGGFYWVFANVTASVDADGNIVGYHSVRRKPRADAVKFIESIYKQLLEAEKIGGMDASLKLLTQILNDNRISYDELVNNLQRG